MMDHFEQTDEEEELRFGAPGEIYVDEDGVTWYPVEMTVSDAVEPDGGGDSDLDFVPLEEMFSVYDLEAEVDEEGQEWVTLDQMADLFAKQDAELERRRRLEQQAAQRAWEAQKAAEAAQLELEMEVAAIQAEEDALQEQLNAESGGQWWRL